MSGSAFDLSDGDLAVVADEVAEPEFDELLAGPAGAVTLRLPDFDPADDPVDAITEWLQEAAYAKKVYDEKLHPRWPKGTQRAGQFMRTGESFMSGGKRWQIVSTAGNVVRAAEASGDVKAVEEKVFKPTAKLNLPAAKPLNVGAGDALPAAWNKNPDLIPVGAKIKSASGSTYERKEDGKFEDVGGFADTYTASDFQNLIGDYTIVSVPPDAKQHAVKGVTVPGITDAPAKRLKGGAHSSDADFNVSLPGGENTTVVSPYVDPSTHDPKIALPSTSKLTADEWKTFGDKDQTYYSELMARFGAWNPQSAKSLMNDAYNSYSSSVKETITEAFHKQYGPGYWGDSGGGRSLNLAFLFSHKNDGPALQAAWKKYEQNKVALDEMNEVTHWDLYNRTRSPDIVLFHGGNNSNNDYTKKYIAGKVPIYAGYSQSYSLQGGEGWGNHILATPVAIPNISLSVYTPPPGHGMEHEKEVAVGVRMKLDDRSVTWNSSNMGMGTTNGAAAQAVRKWLQSKTNLQPAGGWLLKDLKDVWAGKGPIPIPEEPLSLVHQSKDSTGDSWTPLTASTQAEIKGMAKSLKYKSDDGSKEAAVGILDTMGLKAGDFIEGKQGARYVIVKDAADAHGLRYVKVISSGGQVVDDVNATSFGFEASQGHEFYRLDGHIDLPQPKPVKGWTPWTADQYNALSKGEKKQVNKIAVDGLFTYDKEIYKVIGPMSGGKMPVQSMQNGEKYNANTLGVVVEMVPTAKFKPPQEFKVGDKVVFAAAHSGPTAMGDVIDVDGKAGTVDVQWGLGKLTIPNEQVSHAPDLPGVTNFQKGDKFAFNGKGPYTVTTVLKSGTVKAKLSGGSVQAFSAMDLKDNAVVYRPSTFAFGDKEKLKDLPIGAVVSGSPKVVRPYIVEGHVAGKVYLRNLETGGFSGVSKNKSYPRLLTADEIQAAKEAVPPPGSTKPSNTIFDMADYTLGDETTVDQLEIGDKFKGGSGAVYEIVGHSALPDKAYIANKLTDEKSVGIHFGSGAPATPLIPKALAPFDHDALKHGDIVKPGNLLVGDLFQPVQSKGTKQGKIFTVTSVYGDGSISGTEVVGTASYGKIGYGTSKGEMVKYVAPNAPVAQPVEIDPASLPMAEIAFYKWHKSGGGGYTYPKLKAMAVGTVFTDKDDKAWKVKQSGVGGVVVTDGETLFQADGDWRGKLSDSDVAFVDKTESEGGVYATVTSSMDLYNVPVGATVLSTTGAYITHLPSNSSNKKWLIEKPGEPPVATAGKAKAIKFATGKETPNEGFQAHGAKLVAQFGSKLPGSAGVPQAEPKKKRLEPGQAIASVFPTKGEIPPGTKFTAGGSVYTVHGLDPQGDVAVSMESGISGPWAYAPDTVTPPPWKAVVDAPEAAATVADLPDGAKFLNKSADDGHVMWHAFASSAVMTKVSHGNGLMMIKGPTGNAFSVAAGSINGKTPVLPVAADPPAIAPGAKVAEIYPEFGDIPDGTWMVGLDSAEPTYQVKQGDSVTHLYDDEGLHVNEYPKDLKVAGFWTFGGGAKPGLEAESESLPLPEHFALSMVEGDVPAGDLPAFSFARTPDGKVVYKGHNGNFYEVGVKDPIITPDTVTLLQWTGPKPPKDLADLVPGGQQETKLKNLKPGGFFKHGENVFQVIGQGSDGTTGMHLGDWQFVAFDGSNPTVQPLTNTEGVLGVVPPGYSPEPQKMASKDLKPGDIFTIGDQHEHPEHAVYQFVSPPANGKPTQIKLVTPSNEAMSVKPGDVFDWGSSTSSTPFVSVVKHGHEPLEAEPVGTLQVPITHVSQMLPGDRFTVEAHGSTWTWKVVSKEAGGGATIRIVDADPGAPLAVGSEQTVDGPIDVTVTRPSTVPAYLLKTTISDPPDLKGPSGPKVGDKVMAAFATNGDIPEGTVIGSDNSGPFTVHQAAVLTHFLNSMGHPAMKDPKGDVPFGLWKILKLPGEPAAESGWQVGDVIKHQNGPVYEVKTVHPDGAIAVGHPDEKNSLYTYTAGEAQGFLDKGLWTKNPAKIPGPDPTAVVSPLKPYKYHKSGGGGYSYPKLGTLAPGDIFTDKTKTKYMVVGHNGNQTVFGDVSTNAQFSAPSNSFVHLLSNTDSDVQEARLVYLTSGRVALAA